MTMPARTPGPRPQFLLQDERRILTQRAKMASEREATAEELREAAYAVLGSTIRNAEAFRDDVLNIVTGCYPVEHQERVRDAIWTAYGRRLGGTE